MTGRHRSTWSQARRGLYFAQRDMGDLSAAARGPAPLARRLIRRKATRTGFGLARKLGLW
jgi:hypothetical protein